MQNLSHYILSHVRVCDTRSPFNGTVVNIGVKNGKYAYIGTEKPTDYPTEFNFEGSCISPGLADMQAFFGDPGLEHKESVHSGCLAAQAGGFTAVALLPHTHPPIQSKDTVAYIKAKASQYLVELLPMATVTLGQKGEELAELLDLHYAGAIAFTDYPKPVWHSGVLARALQYLQPINALLIQHAEDVSLTQYGLMNEGETSTYLGLKGMPALAEYIAIMRDIELLKYSGGKIHFANVSCAKSVEVIAKAKSEGLQVTCDVAVANLVFTDEALMHFDTHFKVNPPLRTENDRIALWRGLQQGTIDAIVTQHLPHDTESKFLEFDQAEWGMMQLETALSALLTHKPSFISNEQMIEKLTHQPRKLLNLPETSINTHSNANFVVWNPDELWKYTLENKFSAGINSPFFNQELKGKIKCVGRNAQIIAYT